VDQNRKNIDKMKNKNFEDLINEIKRKIQSEEKRIYSEKVIYEYRNPTNFGVIEKPDTAALIKGPCGDTMKITVIIENNIIKKACFWTDGCGATIACGNMITKMIKDKKVEEALNISKNDLIKALDGLPNEHLHCAKLAIDTLNMALLKKY